MTFLQLCQKMTRDLGLTNSISTVVDQTGMNLKIVDWVADADEYIQSLWFDWNFLWSTHSENTIAGEKEITAPSDFGTWDRTGVYLDYGTDDYIHLKELDYHHWRDNYGAYAQSNDEPCNFTIAPNNNIYLESRPDKVYAFTAPYWKTPTRMTVNASTTPIPTRLERIVIARAKIYYAEHEEFDNVFELATKEYHELLDILEATERPGKNRVNKMADNRDSDLVIRTV